MKRDTTTLTLEAGQYLSDKAEEIFKHTNGIHFINAKTGAGKTSLMIDRALSIKGGAICSPMININKQIEHEARVRSLEVGIPASHCEIIQLENLIKLTAQDLACSYKVLFIDEVHHFITDVYRPVFVPAAKLIREVSKYIPVYIMSATVPDVHLLPFPVRTVYNVQSRFSRDATIIRLPTNGKITSNTKKIAKTVHFIHGIHGTPSLLFLNDINRAFNVQRLLRETGLNVVVIQSKTGQLNSRDKHTDPEAAAALNAMIETSTLAATGADVVITTVTLAEGINLNDTITVISCQASPEQLFQQHGRARKDGYHYVITGGAELVDVDDDGTETRRNTGLQRIAIKGLQDIKTARVVVITPDGLEFNTEAGLHGEIIESQRQNKWTATDDEHMNAVGDVYPLYQGLQQEGRFAGQVITGFQDHGYQVVELFDFEDMETKRKANKKPTPTRKEIQAAAIAHGLPETGTADADHPFNVELIYSDMYDPAETLELIDPIFEFVPHAVKYINLYEFNAIDFYFAVPHKQAMFILDVFRQSELDGLKQQLIEVAKEMRETVAELADQHGKRFDSERLQIIAEMFTGAWLNDAVTIFNSKTNGKHGDEQEAIQRGNAAMIAYLCGLRRESTKSRNWCFDADLNPLVLKLDRAEQKQYSNFNNTAKKEGEKQNVELTALEVITHHQIPNKAVIKKPAKERRTLCQEAAAHKAESEAKKAAALSVTW